MARAAALSMKCPEEAMSKSMETLLRFRWSERPHSVVIAVPVVVLTWSVSDVISILFDLWSRGLQGFVFQPSMELQTRRTPTTVQNGLFLWQIQPT